MAQNTNVVVISGNLTRDAELKQLASGSSVLTFSVANNRGFGDHAKVNFIDVKLWGKGASAISQYMTKGKHVTVAGELEQESWEAKDGTKRSKLVVKTFAVELGGGGRNAEPGGERDAGSGDPIDDDTIPF